MNISTDFGFFEYTPIPFFQVGKEVRFYYKQKFWIKMNTDIVRKYNLEYNAFSQDDYTLRNFNDNDTCWIEDLCHTTLDQVKNDHRFYYDKDYYRNTLYIRLNNQKVYNTCTHEISFVYDNPSYINVLALRSSLKDDLYKTYMIGNVTYREEGDFLVEEGTSVKYSKKDFPFSIAAIVVTC